MSDLTYYNYPGVGERNLKLFHYSQAVRLGDKIECSGQGGWDTETGVIPKDLEEEIDRAFANVEHNLKDAGGKGWSQVYKIRSYHTDLGEDAFSVLIRAVKKWCPTHAPVWTCVGVTKLAMADMNIEIEVEAYDPK